MLHNLLLAAGLSDKEAATYLTLLQYGSHPTSFIAQRAKLNRGTAYVMLHSLLAKGLVTKNVRKKVQYFTPLDPHQLLSFLEHRGQELAAVKHRISEVMPELLHLISPLTTKPKIQFFEGIDGARAVLDSTLTASDKTLQAFLSLADIADFVGAEFLEDYTRRRIKQGFTLHAIRTLEKDKAAMSKNVYARRYVTDRKQHRVIRYLPEDLAFPISMYLFDQRLALLSSKAESFALIIESRELCEMQKKLFLLLWNTAKEVKASRRK